MIVSVSHVESIVLGQPKSSQSSAVGLPFTKALCEETHHFQGKDP